MNFEKIKIAKTHLLNTITECISDIKYLAKDISIGNDENWKGEKIFYGYGKEDIEVMLIDDLCDISDSFNFEIQKARERYLLIYPDILKDREIRDQLTILHNAISELEDIFPEFGTGAIITPGLGLHLMGLMY